MRVPVESHSHEIVVRRSRFIAEAVRLDDPAEVRRLVAEVRASHAGCDHVAWAYVYGLSGETVGMSDDHEPKGTAGRPVLDLLQGTGITNILLTVTRYFGGTKLGTGGLVKAYGGAAKAVLSSIKLQEHVDRIRFLLEVPYGVYDAVRRISAELDVVTETERFSDLVHLEGSVPAAQKQRFTALVRDATSGHSEVRYTH